MERYQSLAVILVAILSSAVTPTAVASSEAELKTFILETVSSNPAVQAARAGVDAARALKGGASRPLYNPELGFDLESSEGDVRSLGISQRFDWSNKRGAQIDVASANLAEAQANYDIAAWQVGAELLGSLAAWQLQSEQASLAAERARLMNQFAMLAERRFAVGDLSRVERDFANLAKSNAQIQQANARSDLMSAQQSVARLITGSDRRAWPSIDGIPPALPENLDLQQLATRLPVVRASQSRVIAAQAALDLRRRERRPDPTVGIVAGREAGESLVGVNLSIPLHVRNSFSAEVDAAQARAIEAQRYADDEARRAYTYLVSAADRVRLVAHAWEQWANVGKASLASQTETLRRLWESGDLSTTDYLVQVNETLDLQSNALALRASLWQTWAEWLLASGQIANWVQEEEK